MEKTIRSFLYLIVISGVLFTACGGAPIVKDEGVEDAIMDADVPVSESSSVPVESSAVQSKYVDGKYTANGTYQSPAQVESIDVTVTLEADKIAALSVKSNAVNDTAKIMQGLFIDGINQLVVGKNINELGALSQVNGSSLTSIGFNAAIDSIKAEAAR